MTFMLAKRWIVCAGLPLALLGCQAQRPDVPGDIIHASGVEQAIVFREHAEPIDRIPLAGNSLTLDQAVRLALIHDPRLQSSLAHLRMAEADANQARLLPNPILTIDVRYPVSKEPNAAFEPTLTMDLVQLLEKPAQISAADKRLRESASDALTTALDLINEVQQAYVTARSIDAQMDNSQRRQQILQQLRDLAQKRLDAGDATRLDVLTLDAQSMQATLDLSDLKLQRIEQRLNLAKLIGQPLADAQWKLSAWEAPADATIAPESAWIDAALKNRPEIQSKAWELAALGDDLSANGLSFLQGDAVGIHGEHDPNWRVGPTITTPLPIFDWGQASQDKIHAQVVAARHDLAEQQLVVIQDVRLAYATYLESQKTLVEAQNKLLPLQTQQLEQSRQAYQTGDSDLTVLLLAETDFDVTSSKIVDLQQRVSAALFKLQRAAGGGGVADRIAAANAATQPTTDQAP
jgi:cobalt-zinc-cadmium efflux system outer membrane protein